MANKDIVTPLYNSIDELLKTAKKAEDKVQTVGILQFVSHPALDTITKGVKDALKEAGKLRIEGKDYVAKDGDIFFFRFNV